MFRINTLKKCVCIYKSIYKKLGTKCYDISEKQILLIKASLKVSLDECAKINL
jgi:hypothetical protein